MKIKAPEMESDIFLVSWADMITLLLVFFIYLFSISEINIVKLIESRIILNQLFGGKQSKTPEGENPIYTLRKELQESFAQNNMDSQIQTAQNYNKIVINLSSESFFPVGSADLIDSMLPVLANIADKIKTKSGTIIIEGHTDSDPIKSKEFPSNWELSAARASAVARYFTSVGVSPNNMQVIGYSYHKPLVPNITPENKAKNRRIQITFESDSAIVEDHE